jgi:hypothetical protein
MPRLPLSSLRVALGLAVALLLLPLAAAAQSVGSVVDGLLARARQQVEAADDYTIVTDAFTFYARRTADGSYETATRGPDGQPLGAGAMMQSALVQGAIQGSGPAANADMFNQDTDQVREAFMEGMEMVGTEQVNGTQAYHLRVTDFAALQRLSPQGQQALSPEEQRQMEASFGEMGFYVDAARYVPVRMAMTSNMPSPSGAKIPMTMQMDYLDYRETSGVLFARDIRVHMDVPDEALDAMLEDADEQERQMMRSMMDSMMRDQRLTVTEVRVNTGLDDSLFR